MYFSRHDTSITVPLESCANLLHLPLELLIQPLCLFLFISSHYALLIMFEMQFKATTQYTRPDRSCTVTKFHVLHPFRLLWLISRRLPPFGGYGNIPIGNPAQYVVRQTTHESQWLAYNGKANVCTGPRSIRNPGNEVIPGCGTRSAMSFQLTNFCTKP